MRLSHRDTSVMYLWTLLFISSFSCTAVSNSIEISCELAKQKEPVLALVTSNTSFGVEETRGKRLLCYFHVSLWLTLVRARVCVWCVHWCTSEKLMCTGGEQRRMPGALLHHSPHILPSRPFTESEVPHFSEAGWPTSSWELMSMTSNSGWQAAMPGFYVRTGDLNSKPLPSFHSQHS